MTTTGESRVSLVAVSLAVPAGLLAALWVSVSAQPHAWAILVGLSCVAAYLHWIRTESNWSKAGRLFAVFFAGMLGAMLLMQFLRGLGVAG